MTPDDTRVAQPHAALTFKGGHALVTDAAHLEPMAAVAGWERLRHGVRVYACLWMASFHSASIYPMAWVYTIV